MSIDDEQFIELAKKDPQKLIEELRDDPKKLADIIKKITAYNDELRGVKKFGDEEIIQDDEVVKDEEEYL